MDLSLEGFLHKKQVKNRSPRVPIVINKTDKVTVKRIRIGTQEVTVIKGK